MATRTFIDRAGTEWTIWRVTPGEHAVGSRQATSLPEELADGWLCFESATGKRRVYPVPPDWESLSDPKLEILCRAGVPVAPKRSSALTAAIHGAAPEISAAPPA